MRTSRPASRNAMRISCTHTPRPSHLLHPLWMAAPPNGGEAVLDCSSATLFSNATMLERSMACLQQQSIAVEPRCNMQ